MKLARTRAALSSSETRSPYTLSVLCTMRLIDAASSGVFGRPIITGSARRKPPDWARR